MGTDYLLVVDSIDGIDDLVRRFPGTLTEAGRDPARLWYDALWLREVLAGLPRRPVPVNPIPLERDGMALHRLSVAVARYGRDLERHRAIDAFFPDSSDGPEYRPEQVTHDP